ncbi:hypothetical protein Zm00014a_005782, partial [Zea mays]
SANLVTPFSKIFLFSLRLIL